MVGRLGWGCGVVWCPKFPRNEFMVLNNVGQAGTGLCDYIYIDWFYNLKLW